LITGFAVKKTNPAPVKVPEKSPVKLAFLAARCEELKKKILKNMMTRVKISLVLLANTLIKDGKSARNNHVLGL